MGLCPKPNLSRPYTLVLNKVKFMINNLPTNIDKIIVDSQSHKYLTKIPFGCKVIVKN